MMPSLGERVAHIELLMRYAVPEQDLPQAQALVARFRADTVALHLLHEFYSYLPEAVEDAVVDLRLAARRRGVCLLMARTAGGQAFFYLVSSEGATFLGPAGAGIWDPEVLQYFRLRERPALAGLDTRAETLPPYRPIDESPEICPACGVSAGDCHVLGCPVETCPWCGGQLTRCPCRFEQLDTAEIAEEEIGALARRLEAQGRIPFDPARERPGYLQVGASGKPVSGSS
ncbi:MAG: hypothetical protein AB1634_04950 [Thermodesulfobacteriota bacterium]